MLSIPLWFEGGVAPVMEAGFIGGILWLVYVATFGAWGLYYVALRRSSPARVTAVLYLSSPVVMIWAWIMFGEPLPWAMAGGLPNPLQAWLSSQGHGQADVDLARAGIAWIFHLLHPERIKTARRTKPERHHERSFLMPHQKS